MSEVVVEPGLILTDSRARGVFYERVGYQEFGRLEEFPLGSARHFLWKSLP